MRMIAGKFKGRKIEVPQGRDIRPTSDKVRGAIFNALGARMDLRGGRVLDAFCGTGALGLEALSRGAAHCTFVDLDKTALALAKANALTFGLKDETSFMNQDAAKLIFGDPAQKYDLVFLDPPYHKGLIDPVLKALTHGGLSKGAHVIVECEKDHAPDMPDGFEILSTKLYGDTKILFCVANF